MAAILYKPLGILFGVLGGLIAGALFKRIWAAIADDPEPPKATRQDASWGEVLPAAALQGAVFAGVKAAVDRGGARGFQKLTGVWPGDKD